MISSGVSVDFWEIYDIYYGPVRMFIMKLVGDAWAADDLTQETFMKVRENLDGLRDSSKLRPWVFRIARNRCLDFFRSRTPENVAPNMMSGPQNSVEPLAEMQLEQYQMSECVQDKIHMLPEALRVVLILSDTMELSQKEIADILDIKAGNVKVRLHRARKALKEILERYCTFEHDDRNVMVCQPKPNSASTLRNASLEETHP
jgi:RNA polymerase sigma-70 factor (ECF subfamily)